MTDGTRPKSHTTDVALSVGLIVEAGLELTSEIGLSSLSMRNVAKRLGVTPMALYNHIDNKRHLVDLVVEAAVSKGNFGLSENDDPYEAIQAMAAEARRIYKIYPGLAEHLLIEGPPGSALGVVEAALEVYQRTGATRDEAVVMYDLIATWTLSVMVAENATYLARRRSAGADRHDRERVDRLIEAWASTATCSKNATPELDPDAQFERGVTWLLEGMRRSVNAG